MSTTHSGSTSELTLAGYLIVLWRYGLWIAVTTLTFGALAFAASAAREPLFEGSAKLLVSASKIGDVAAPTVSMGTFINLVNNRNLVLETMTELGLTKPPRVLTLSQAVNRITVSAVRDAAVIEVRARFWEPALAANFANRLAERAVALAGTLSQQDTVNARDMIKVQLEESKARLDRAERDLEVFQQKAQLDLLTEDTDALLRLRGSLSTLLAEIEEERGRARRLAEDLSKETPVRDVRRSLEGTASQLRQPVGEDADADRALRLRSELLDPYANPVHEMLSQQLSASRARLAGLETRRAEVMRVIGGSQAGIAKMSDVYAKQVELERLRTELTLASSAYEEVSNRYEQARLQVAGRSTQLQLIERALPPDFSSGPRVWLAVAMAMALGFGAAAAVALLVTVMGAARVDGDPVER